MPRHLEVLHKNSPTHFLDENDKLITNGLRKQLIKIEKKKIVKTSKRDTNRTTNCIGVQIDIISTDWKVYGH